MMEVNNTKKVLEKVATMNFFTKKSNSLILLESAMLQLWSTTDHVKNNTYLCKAVKETLTWLKLLSFYPLCISVLSLLQASLLHHIVTECGSVLYSFWKKHSFSHKQIKIKCKRKVLHTTNGDLHTCTTKSMKKSLWGTSGHFTAQELYHFS